MTDAINAKSEALELRECSSKELDAVSGGQLGGLMGVGRLETLIKELNQQMVEAQQRG
jgi:hypothetical protein